MTHKVFLLDAMALIYRAHFAFANAPRINSKGINTSATFGFTNTFLEIIQKEKPSHLAVAFDTSAPTFRHLHYPDYKAHRQAQPEDIALNIPFCMQMLEAFQIPILLLDGYEADDIIGTLAKRLASQETDVYMMTSDKDYCQLVEEHIFVYRPAYMGKGAEVYTIEKVLERFQIKNVDQVRDILGLQGDASDNIPGIPGIGEKTAVKFLDQFGSVEGLIANAHTLTGKMKENIIQFAEQGVLSKYLATIDIQVPIHAELKDFTYKGFDPIKLGHLLDELEFKQMKSKLLGSVPSENNVVKPAPKSKTDTAQMSLFGGSTEAQISSVAVTTTIEIELQEETSPKISKIRNIHNTPHRYHLVTEESEMLELIEYLKIQSQICFDTETTSLEEELAELVGLSFCYTAQEAYYIPIPEDRTTALKILDLFKPIFENSAIGKIGQNIKYDIRILNNYGIEVKGLLFDTLIAHYLLEPDQRHGMDALSHQFLKYQPISISELIGKKGKTQKNMREVPLEEIKEYAAEDADVTWQLKAIFEPLLKESKVLKLASEVEFPLISVLASMEKNGVKIDTSALLEFSGILETEIKLSEKAIYELAGEIFNIASPKQLGIILFEKLKLEDKPKKTETGQYATGEEILSKLALEHPIADTILTYREFQKLKSTYVDALPLMMDPQTGRIHTSYNQAVAATGRLSSTQPNLQNIPIRTEKGKEIRKAFIPSSSDHLIVSADYSQIELRIMAAFSHDPAMIEAFKNGIDIHATTASKVFQVPLEEVTGDMRRKAKMVNFGIIYGISAFGLAQRLSIPRREAAEIIEAYFTEFAAIKTYMDATINLAREQEFVETILGRRRYLRDINSRNQTQRGFAERNAINAPIQGSAADIIKVAMIQIHDELQKQKLGTKMILQVHDELVFDVPKSELEVVKTLVQDKMIHALPLSVPMEVGIGWGENWLLAH